MAALAGGTACDDESFLCTNTPGGFSCDCPGGTELIDEECREPSKWFIARVEDTDGLT